MKYSLFLKFGGVFFAGLGLHCCEGYSLAVVYGFLIAMASLAATPGL